MAAVHNYRDEYLTCKSAEVKPTAHPITGAPIPDAMLLEIDTGKVFIFDGEAEDWIDTEEVWG